MDLIFTREENVEGPNRGFIVDQILVHSEDGEYIGKIKIEMIPAAEFARWYPTVVDYMVHIHGWAIGQHGLPDVIGTMTLDKFKALAWYLWRQEYPNLKEGPELDHLVKKLVRGVNRKYASKFNRFKKYHCDAPRPAWVEVREDYRRRGIGTQLYVEAYKWVKEKGLTLRCSDTITKEAAAVWQNFLEKGMAERRGDFIYFTG